MLLKPTIRQHNREAFFDHQKQVISQDKKSKKHRQNRTLRLLVRLCASCRTPGSGSAPGEAASEVVLAFLHAEGQVGSITFLLGGEDGSTGNDVVLVGEGAIEEVDVEVGVFSLVATGELHLGSGGDRVGVSANNLNVGAGRVELDTKRV